MLTLTADEEYSLRNRQTFWQPIQLQLSKKQIFFSQFLAACLKFASNVERFQKKMTVKGYVFLKLETAKMWLVKGLKNLLLEHLATVNMLSSQKTFTQHFHHIVSSLWQKMSLKILVLVYLKSYECLLTD